MTATIRVIQLQEVAIIAHLHHSFQFEYNSALENDKRINGEAITFQLELQIESNLGTNKKDIDLVLACVSNRTGIPVKNILMAHYNQLVPKSREF